MGLQVINSDRLIELSRTFIKYLIEKIYSDKNIILHVFGRSRDNHSFLPHRLVRVGGLLTVETPAMRVLGIEIGRFRPRLRRFSANTLYTRF